MNKGSIHFIYSCLRVQAQNYIILERTRFYVVFHFHLQINEKKKCSSLIPTKHLDYIITGLALASQEMNGNQNTSNK